MSEMPNSIELQPGVTYRVPVRNGHLALSVSSDPENPGVDVEYISDNDKPEDTVKTRPRVLIEHTGDTNQLRAVAWANPLSEDYSHCIIFK